MGPMKTDPNKQMMPLTIISLRGPTLLHVYLLIFLARALWKISNIARYHNVCNAISKSHHPINLYCIICIARNNHFFHSKYSMIKYSAFFYNATLIAVIALFCSFLNLALQISRSHVKDTCLLIKFCCCIKTKKCFSNFFTLQNPFGP